MAKRKNKYRSSVDEMTSNWTDSPPNAGNFHELVEKHGIDWATGYYDALRHLVKQLDENFTAFTVPRENWEGKPGTEKFLKVTVDNSAPIVHRKTVELFEEKVALLQKAEIILKNNPSPNTECFPS